MNEHVKHNDKKDTIIEVDVPNDLYIKLSIIGRETGETPDEVASRFVSQYLDELEK